MDKNAKIFIGIVALVVLGVAAAAIVRGGPASQGPGKYDQFAQCLKEKGAIFYGAYWCPHCQAQKKLFGSSAKFLPYEECSTADGQGQLQACTEKGVKTYPTWIFADGSRLQGEIPLETLAEKTLCELPDAGSDETQIQ
jgi:hypothetical protein